MVDLRIANATLDVKRLDRRRWLAGACVLGCTALVAALWALAAELGPLGHGVAPVLLAACVGVVAGLLVLARPRMGRRLRGGALSCGGGVLTVERAGKSWRFSLTEVAHGWRELGSGETVVLRLHDNTEVTAAALSSGDAERLLAAAGVGLADRSLEIEAEPPRRLSTVTGCTVLGSAFVWAPAASIAMVELFEHVVGRRGGGVGLAVVVGPVLPLTVLALWALARTAFTARIAIGRDGVHLRRPLRRGLYLEHADIDAVTVDEHGELEIGLRGRDPVRLRLEGEQAEAIAQRIHEARQRLVVEPDAVDLGALERRGEAIAPWLARLATLLAHSGYRALVVARSDLLEVVEDPRAPAARRVAAAAALAPVADEALRARLRIAADTSANPPLRVALEAAAAGTLDEEIYREAEEAMRAGCRS